MNGQTYHIEMSPDSVWANHWVDPLPGTYIFAWNPPVETTKQLFEITFYGDSTTGTFPAKMTMDLPSGYYIPVSTSPTDVITITEFGPVNSHISGSFTGKVIKEGTTDTSTFTCSFRAKRLY
jgi:hypothetical protein